MPPDIRRAGTLVMTLTRPQPSSKPEHRIPYFPFAAPLPVPRRHALQGRLHAARTFVPSRVETPRPGLFSALYVDAVSLVRAMIQHVLDASA